MNEFVNFYKRGIELPAGCKDLIDAIPRPRQSMEPVQGFEHIERYLTQLVQSGVERCPGRLLFYRLPSSVPDAADVMVPRSFQWLVMV